MLKLAMDYDFVKKFLLTEFDEKLIAEAEKHYQNANEEFRRKGGKRPHIIRVMLEQGLIDVSRHNELAKKLKSLTPEELKDTVPAEVPKTLEERADESEINVFATFIKNPGILDDKRYVVEREIGRGGMGVVEKAVDLKFSTPDYKHFVAMKKILPGMIELEVEGGTEEQRKNVMKAKEARFLREKNITGRFTKNPNIISTTDVGYDNQGNLCLVMEYVDGFEFSHVLDELREGKTRKYPLKYALDKVVQALDALDYIHNKGVIHRDVKPGNMMIDEFNLIKLMDFGLAKDIGMAEVKADSSLDVGPADIGLSGIHRTQQGQAIGTPAYMSPEQIEDSTAVDPRTDIYAMGVILYEVLTGSVPHTGANVPELLWKVLSDDPVPPSKVLERIFDVPKPLEFICMKSLEKDRKYRWKNAKEFADAIRAFESKDYDQIPGYRPSLGEKVNKLAAKRPRAFIGSIMGTVGGLLLASAIGIGIGAYKTEEAKNARLEREKVEAEAEAAKELASKEKEKRAALELVAVEKDKRMELLEEQVAQQKTDTLLERLKYISQGDNYYEATLEILQSAIEQSKNYWRPYLLLAKHYATFGKHDLAEDNFKKANQAFKKKTGSESLEIWFEAGMHYGLPVELGGRGLEDLALEYFERAYASDSENVFGRLSHAVSLVIKARQNPDQAEGFLQDATEISDKLITDSQASSIDGTWLVRSWVYGASVFSEYDHPMVRKHSDLEEAKKALSRISRTSMRHIGVQNFLGAILSKQKEYEKAIQVYDQLLHFFESASIYNNRGVAQRESGDLEAALSDFSSAIQQASDCKEAYLNRGITYYDLRQFDKALADLNQAISLDSDYADAYHNRGLTHKVLNNLEDALRDWTRAVRLKPDNVDAHYNLGNLYRGMNDLDRAIECYTCAIDHDSQYAPALNNRGLTYLDMRNYDAAIQDLDRAIQLDSNYLEAYVNRGSAYYDIEQFDRAISDYQIALSLNPKSWQTMYNLGSIFLEKEDFSQSLSYFKQCLSYAPAGYHSRIKSSISTLEQKLKEK